MALRVHEDELGKRRLLAKGGMAFVFDLPEYRTREAPDVPVVYKKYKSKIRPIPIFGLEQLVKMRDGWPQEQRKAIDASFNWMVRVVIDDRGGAAGVILPRLDNAYFIEKFNSYGEVTTTLAEAQDLSATHEFFQRWRIPNPTIEQRLVICRSLVAGMGKLHRAGVIYGDLSLRNFLYRLSPTPSVMYVDADAIRPRSGSSALGKQPHTGDWEPPEAIIAQRRKDSVGFAIQNFETDRYKLGLAILRILAQVPRAGERRDPQLVKNVLPGRLYPLLERSINGNPADRPTAKEWYEEFTR